MANLFYIITIIISIFVRASFQDKANVPAVGTDCLGKDFLCVDQKQFLICVDYGNRFHTADQQMQTCGSLAYCDNKMNYECASSAPVTDTPEKSLTTVESQAVEITVVTTTESPVLTTTQSQVENSVTTVASQAVVETTVVTTTESEVLTTAQSQVNVTDTTTLLVTVPTTPINESTNLIGGNTTTTDAETTTVLKSETVTEAKTTQQITTVTEPESTTIRERPGNETNPTTTTPVTIEGTSDTANATTPLAENAVVNSTTAQNSTTLSSGVTEETTKDVTNETVTETTEVTRPSTWGIGTTTTPAPTTTTPPIICRGSGFQPHPTDCRKFIICIKINRYYRVIDIPCSFNRAYDPKTKRCSTDVAKLCGKSIFACTSTGYFKDPYSCNKYYQCLAVGNGKFLKWEFSCSPDFVYNEYFKRCRQSGRNRKTDENHSGESRSSIESKENNSNDSE